MKQKRANLGRPDECVTIETTGKATIAYHPPKSSSQISAERRKVLVSRLMAHSQFIMPRVMTTTATNNSSNNSGEKTQLLNSKVYDWKQPAGGLKLNQEYIKKSVDAYPQTVDFFADVVSGGGTDISTPTSGSAGASDVSFNCGYSSGEDSPVPVCQTSGQATTSYNSYTDDTSLDDLPNLSPLLLPNFTSTAVPAPGCSENDCDAQQTQQRGQQQCQYQGEMYATNDFYLSYLSFDEKPGQSQSLPGVATIGDKTGAGVGLNVPTIRWEDNQDGFSQYALLDGYITL